MLSKPTFFRSIMDLMGDASRLVVVQFGKDYSEGNYYRVMEKFIKGLDGSVMRNTGKGSKILYARLKNRLETSMEL